MLPRVATEYGQRSWARAISSAAVAAVRFGACRSSETASPKPPCPVGPIPTVEVMADPDASRPRPRATPSSADWKQAA